MCWASTPPRHSFTGGETEAQTPQCGVQVSSLLRGDPHPGPSFPSCAAMATVMAGRGPWLLAEVALRAPLSLAALGGPSWLSWRGVQERGWVSHTYPHLLFPFLQALLTPAGHASHHHGNPAGPPSSPACEDGGVWVHKGGPAAAPCLFWERLPSLPLNAVHPPPPTLISPQATPNLSPPVSPLPPLLFQLRGSASSPRPHHKLLTRSPN